MRPIIAVALALLVVAGVTRAEGSKILIVNLQRLIDESDEGKFFVKKLQDEIAAKKEKAQLEVRNLQERQKNLLKVQSADRDEQWYADVKDLFEKISKLKADEQFFIASKNDEIARAVTQLIQGAQTEAKKIMKKRGASIVLISRTGPLKINSEGDLKDEIIFRRVLCVDPKLEADITNDVLKAMNKWFRENRAKTNPNPRRKGGSKNG